MIEVELIAPDGTVSRMGIDTYLRLPDDMPARNHRARFVLHCSCGLVHELATADDVAQALLAAGRARAAADNFSRACTVRPIQ